MRKNARILVTHDFSECSHTALDYGVEFAVENRAELHFLHVEVLHDDVLKSSEPEKTKAELLREALRKDILSSLEKQGMQFTDLDVIKYSVLRNASAGQAILKYCTDYEIDLVVMGTHGRRGLRRTLIGSVAEEVVRLAPCDVFTVRENLEFASLEEGLRRITVPIDFSSYSRQALIYGKELAASFEAELDLVHVVEDKLHPIFQNAGATSIYDLHPEIEKNATDALEALHDETPGPDVPVRYVVLRGHPVHEIVDWTENQPCDMVVISTHGHSGLERTILGSVTERVVRHAACPVITVHAGKPVVEEKPRIKPDMNVVI